MGDFSYVLYVNRRLDENMFQSEIMFFVGIDVEHDVWDNVYNKLIIV